MVKAKWSRSVKVLVKRYPEVGSEAEEQREMRQASLSGCKLSQTDNGSLGQLYDANARSEHGDLCEQEDCLTFYSRLEDISCETWQRQSLSSIRRPSGRGAHSDVCNSLSSNDFETTEYELKSAVGLSLGTCSTDLRSNMSRPCSAQLRDIPHDSWDEC